MLRIAGRYVLRSQDHLKVFVPSADEFFGAYRARQKVPISSHVYSAPRERRLITLFARMNEETKIPWTSAFCLALAGGSLHSVEVDVTQEREAATQFGTDGMSSNSRPIMGKR